MTTTTTLTESEAIDLAISALNEKIEGFHFDARAAQMLGDAVPHEIRMRLARLNELYEAVKVLQGLKWWDGVK